MKITTYRIRTSSLKKISNRTQIELTKKSNQTNLTQSKIESIISEITNFLMQSSKRGTEAIISC
jgi:hypothetical protein